MNGLDASLFPAEQYPYRHALARAQWLLVGLVAVDVKRLGLWLDVLRVNEAEGLRIVRDLVMSQVPEVELPAVLEKNMRKMILDKSQHYEPEKVRA